MHAVQISTQKVKREKKGLFVTDSTEEGFGHRTERQGADQGLDVVQHPETTYSCCCSEHCCYYFYHWVLELEFELALVLELHHDSRCAVHMPEASVEPQPLALPFLEECVVAENCTSSMEKEGDRVWGRRMRYAQVKVMMI